MAATNTITNLAAQVAEATDIRDIRPLVEIPNHWIWLWVALGALLLAGLAWWLWNRRQKHTAEIPVVPPIPAHLLARQRLEQALALIEQPKPFIVAVSDTLRAYLEGAFHLRAPEQTTEEFLVELQHSELLSDVQKQSLGDFLQSCDMVKFARYEPRESELRELHDYAVELVTQTEPLSGDSPQVVKNSGPPQPGPGDEQSPSEDHRS